MDRKIVSRNTARANRKRRQEPKSENSITDLTVDEIEELVPGAEKKQLEAWLDEELAGKERKTVIEMLSRELEDG